MDKKTNQQKSITQFFKSNEKRPYVEKQGTSDDLQTTPPTKKPPKIDDLKITEQFHPPTDYIFPKTKCGDKLRSCQAHWFKSFPWLHYDEK